MRYENIFINKNTIFVKEIAVQQQNGLPLNISGYTGSFKLAKHFESTTKYSATVTILDAVNGVFKVTMSSTDTAMLPDQTLVFSFMITPPSAEPLLILQGQAFVTPTVV